MHSVYPYSAGSHRPSDVHARLGSPTKKKPSLHSNATVEPGTNKKFDFRPKRGVSKTPHDNTRLNLNEKLKKTFQALENHAQLTCH